YAGCCDRVGRRRGGLFCLQVRMKLVELPDLPICPPPGIARTGVSQICPGDGLEAARRVEACRELVGKRFVVDKAVCACRRDGALVEVHGIEWASLDARNLGADQRCTILEILRTIRGQEP